LKNHNFFNPPSIKKIIEGENLNEYKVMESGQIDKIRKADNFLKFSQNEEL
jgi:hypothetical protein